MATHSIDRELAEAIANTESNVRPVDASHAASSSKKVRNLGLIAVLLALVGTIVALFMVGFKEAAIYAITVDQLVTHSSKYVGKKVRVEGELVPGSLVKRDSPCEYRYTVQAGTSKVDVRYAQCIIPDTFRDMPAGGVQVTTEGTLTSEGFFQASLVMAKCSSKYDPNTHQMNSTGAPATQ